MKNMACIECNGSVPAEDSVLVGEVLECPDCGVELEVTRLEPLQAELAPEIEEDWGE